MTVAKSNSRCRRDSVARSTHFCACTANTGPRSVAAIIAKSLTLIFGNPVSIAGLLPELLPDYKNTLIFWHGLRC
jgi:hypothetical protein